MSTPPPIRHACFLLLAAAASLHAEAPPTVVYGGLSDKGIPGAKVIKGRVPFSPPRPRPAVAYLPQGPSPDTPGQAGRIPVDLIERQGVARANGAVAFGFPIAQGALYDLHRLHLRDADGKEPLQQVSALALWPDGSIKSALIQTTAPFAAHERKPLVVEFGGDLPPRAAAAPLEVKARSAGYVVSTGAIRVEVATDGFVPFKSVTTPEGRPIAKGGALEIADENGDLFTSALGKPERVSVERQGPLDAVLRVEGKYHNAKKGAFMRYVARLRFEAGSSRVDIILNHINDGLENEFADFSRVGFRLDLHDANSLPRLSMEPGEPQGDTVKLAQWDADSAEVNGAARPARASGTLAFVPATGADGVQLAIRHFWQRWPKGLEATPGHVSVELLPKLPSATFGREFPFYLAFPFVEGRYRLKWGMAFTERMSVDFRATGAPAQLEAEVNAPVTAILPPAYVASTGVFGPIHTPRDSALKARWLAFTTAAFGNYHFKRELQKEYGVFSFGDWFGERDRNWGNNEYDIPHGFFAHFLAGGAPEFLDEAVNGVRHQADSDIVHAYPDPFYIGANPQHSIGHTGISYQRVTPAWSYQYDGATSAGNGHTWSDGMADCWLLTGDPVVMEALLALGEHIRWAFVPGFKTLGALERSGGWSIQAALGAYRATSDPVYLEAASAIAALALKGQDAASGVWPHELPAAHAGNKTGVVGNNTYNIGILLMGLGKYHALTGDPAVLEALRRGAAWVERSWLEEGGWSYSSDTAGKPLRPRPSIHVNPLIYPSLAYTGLVTQNPRLVHLAERALAATLDYEKPESLQGSPVKLYSIKSYATTETFAWLALAHDAGLGAAVEADAPEPSTPSSQQSTPTLP